MPKAEEGEEGVSCCGYCWWDGARYEHSPMAFSNIMPAVVGTTPFQNAAGDSERMFLRVWGMERPAVCWRTLKVSKG